MLQVERNLVIMLGFLFEALKKDKVDIIGRVFTIEDMVEKYKKTYEKGVSWDKNGYGDFSRS